MTRAILSITLLATVFPAIVSCSTTRTADDFPAGLSKAELVHDFGEAASIQTLVKQSDAVFGPIESFWATLAPGDSVEIWSYAVEGGSAELYFVNGADTAGGVGFAPDGVVY